MSRDWCKVDLALMTARALDITRRESPIIAVYTNPRKPHMKSVVPPPNTSMIATDKGTIRCKPGQAVAVADEVADNLVRYHGFEFAEGYTFTPEPEQIDDKKAS